MGNCKSMRRNSYHDFQLSNCSSRLMVSSLELQHTININAWHAVSRKINFIRKHKEILLCSKLSRNRVVRKNSRAIHSFPSTLCYVIYIILTHVKQDKNKTTGKHKPCLQTDKCYQN